MVSVAGRAIVASIIAVGTVVVLTTWFLTTRHELLPELLDQGHYTLVYTVVVTLIWCFSVAALLALLLSRPYSVLDVWLLVVLTAWLFDIALSAIVNHGRFDLGFYAGRAYGLCAASFVLGALLIGAGFGTDELIARGGFGSPTLFVDGTDMYFGNDQLPLVEFALNGRRR